MWQETDSTGTTVRWIALDGRLLSVWRIEEPLPARERTSRPSTRRHAAEHATIRPPAASERALAPAVLA